MREGKEGGEEEKEGGKKGRNGEEEREGGKKERKRQEMLVYEHVPLREERGM